MARGQGEARRGKEGEEARRASVTCGEATTPPGRSLHYGKWGSATWRRTPVSPGGLSGSLSGSPLLTHVHTHKQTKKKRGVGLALWLERTHVHIHTSTYLFPLPLPFSPSPPPFPLPFHTHSCTRRPHSYGETHARTHVPGMVGKVSHMSGRGLLSPGAPPGSDRTSPAFVVVTPLTLLTTPDLQARPRLRCD